MRHDGGSDRDPDAAAGSSHPVAGAADSRPSAGLPPRGNAPGAEWLSGRAIGLIISTGALFAILAIRSQTFLSAYTMFVVSRQVAFYVLIALAQGICLVVGGMNLSVGAIGSMATVVLGLLLDTAGLPAALAVAGALAFGCLAGLLNGAIITGLKIDSFIVTISMMFMYMGLRSGISGGAPYRVPPGFTAVGQGTLMGIPYVFLIMLGLLAFVSYMFRNTVFGRRLLAVGGNRNAAYLSGINADRMVLGANALSGFLAALAAVLWASQLGSAAPETGDDWLIVSFAVAIIGGTALNGGAISPFGILMGAAIYMLIQHGLIEVEANPYYARSFLGALILLAIVVDRVREVYGARHLARSGA